MQGKKTAEKRLMEIVKGAIKGVLGLSRGFTGAQQAPRIHIHDSG